MKAKLISWSKNLIRPLMAITFLIILIKKGPFQLDQIKSILSQQKVLLAGFSLILIQFSITAYRWKLLVELKTQISLFVAIQLTLVGHFFSFFIPGGVGGDIVKALELSKSKTVSRAEALSTVLADRILGLFSMVFFSMLFLLIDYALDGQSTILKYLLFSGVLFTGMLVGLSFGSMILQFVSRFFSEKQHHLLTTLQKTIHSFELTFLAFKKKKLLSKVVLLSLVLQFISISFMSLVVESAGVEIPSYLVFFSLCCFGFLASAIPITPAGIGVGQAAFYFLFTPFSEELGKAAVTAISALQLFQFFYALIGGVLFSAKPFLAKNKASQ